MVSRSLSTRLAALEARFSGASEADINRVLKLMARVEELTGEPWAVALHNDRCPRGWTGKRPLRDPATVSGDDVLAWYMRKGWPRPDCPLCTPEPANSTEENR